MKKRVSIARALVMEPQLLLYDEPTSELDPVMSATISEIIATLKHEYSVTSLVVTHDRALALTISNRVGILMDGEADLPGHPRRPQEVHGPAHRRLPQSRRSTSSIPALRSSKLKTRKHHEHRTTDRPRRAILPPRRRPRLGDVRDAQRRQALRGAQPHADRGLRRPEAAEDRRRGPHGRRQDRLRPDRPRLGRAPRRGRPPGRPEGPDRERRDGHDRHVRADRRQLHLDRHGHRRRAAPRRRRGDQDRGLARPELDHDARSAASASSSRTPSARSARPSTATARTAAGSSRSSTSWSPTTPRA